MFHTIFVILCLIFLSSTTTARATYTGSSPTSVVNYTLYDSNGNLKTLNENGSTASTITCEYDALNRITSYTARGETIGHRYYANDQLAKIIYPGGAETGTGHAQVIEENEPLAPSGLLQSSSLSSTI